MPGLVGEETGGLGVEKVQEKPTEAGGISATDLASGLCDVYKLRHTGRCDHTVRGL